MKRFILLSLSVVLGLAVASAKPRSEQQARQLAADFLSSLSASGVHRAPSVVAARAIQWNISESEEPAFYVFNRGEDDGFVIISADDRAYTVVGYANSGHFDEEDMPINMRSWLKGYEREIAYLRTLPEREHSMRPRAPQRKQQSYTPVSPICTTVWGQGYPYNLQAPSKKNKKNQDEQCVTGCVATAAAQVMKAHNWPTTGIGSNSYKWGRGANDSLTLSANFGATTYQWDKMLNKYSGVTTTQEQRDAVATLMYHCGVSCYMHYDLSENGGSGAVSAYMASALRDNFNYDRGMQFLIKDYMGDTVMLNFIYEDLKKGNPVLFSGRTVNDEGHAFVCDGIDADGLLHINWGWNGNSDNYFRLSLLDPDDQGTGGSSGNLAFTENVSAYANIVPNENGAPRHTIVGLNAEIENKRLTRTDEVVIRIDTMINYGLESWSGNPVMLIYKNGALYDKVVGTNTIKAIDPYWYYYYQYVRVDLSNLPEGNYEIVPSVNDINYTSNIFPVYVYGYGEYRCPISVTADSIIVAEPGALPDPYVPQKGDSIHVDDYNFTELTAYNYAGVVSGAERWQLQLTTADFYENSATQQACMMIVVNSKSAQSFLGSFTVDGEVDNKCVGMVLYIGNISSYEANAAKSGECTIVYNPKTSKYTIHYSVLFGGKNQSGQIELPENMVVALREEGKNESDVTLDNTIYSGMTTTLAKTRTQSLGTNVYSDIPFVVSGEISTLVNTPEQTKYYTQSRFYLSDGTNEFYCYNTKWLNGGDFVTGEEIALGGRAAVFGKLYNYLGTTPEISAGYICEYHEPDTTKYDPFAEDAENAEFIEDFDSYSIDEEMAVNGYTWIKAINSKMAVVELLMIFPEGATKVSEGRYPVSSSGEYQTIYMSSGLSEDGTFYGSFADYVDNNYEFVAPYWFIVAGEVIVDAEGNILLNAVNSKGMTVLSHLFNSREPIEVVGADEKDAVRKELRDGQVLIIKNGKAYTIYGTEYR